jgi:hypothetical protein
MSDLLIGIKRKVHRRDDRGALGADAEFTALRKAALEQSGYRCVRCGLESPAIASRTSALQVHHADDDHANNAPNNLHPYCTLDHAVHHIGCDAPSAGGHEGWASRMRIGYIPALSAEDLNLLQRAVGAALAEPTFEPIAQQVLSLLGVLSLPVRDVYGSNQAKDFAAAMSVMTDVQYEDRKVDGLRVLFHPDILKEAGARMVTDQPLMAPKNWQTLVKGKAGNGDAHGIR